MSRETWKPEIFDALFRNNPDPWDFENSPYEREKLAHVLACLPASSVSFILELGCAIGVGTLALSQRCERILGVDASDAALAIAHQRCRELEHVSFIRAFLPEAYPAAEASDCDLVLVSELLYFLAPDDIRRLAFSIINSLKADGCILLVNWTGETDTPCTGHQAAECFIEACRERQWEPDLAEQGGSYRIDRLRHTRP